MTDPHLRAADADRSAVASTLGEHMAAGRLTVAEYEERLERAYAAKTYGELAELTADLPSTPAAARDVARVESGALEPAGRWDWARSDAWQAWLRTAGIVIGIWAITSLASWELLYFWPIWVLGPWGVVLLVSTLTGDDRDDDEDEDDEEPGPQALPGR
jgi:hypothetical protein